MSSQRQTPHHILIVDDYEYVFHVVARMLRKAGYRVTATMSARDALALIQSGSPKIDLLLTDIRMPEFSGPELARAARLADPDLPLVFMSGYTDYDELIAPFSSCLLQKPFTMQTLLRTIELELVGRD